MIDVRTSRKLNVSRLLRPIRLAFVVPPEDPKALRAVFETNTCLWGGVQNPVVPVYRRRPRHWEDRWEWPGGVDYAKAMLRAFEPDFVVETKEGLANGLQLPERRVIKLRDVLDPHRESHVGYGVSAVDALRHAYEEDLKFVRRHKLIAAWDEGAEARPDLLKAAAVGTYPRDPSLQYFKKWYSDLFEPESPLTQYAELVDALVTGVVTPLRAHLYGLRDRPGMGWRANEAILFLLNPESVSDVTDYWNLRAWGLRCFPLPVGAVRESVAAVVPLITRENVRLRGNPDPNMKHRTTLLKARSVPEASLREAASLLKPIPPDSLVLKDSLPRYWNSQARAYDAGERGELVGEHDDLDVAVEDRRIRFDLLEPKLETFGTWSGLPRWANTISLRDYSATESGLVFPREGAELSHLLRSFDLGGSQSLRSGIAVTSSGHSTSQWWEVPDGQTVIHDWFAGQKLAFKPSAAGKTAVEVARAVGGLQGLRLLDSVQLLDWLEKASRGGRLLQHELFGLLKRTEEHPKAPGNLLRSLVERNVLRLGLLLPCPACGTEGWFALEELGAALRCERCLRTFRFPSDNPPKNKWAYRTLGPFAVSGYANGAYTTLLALRALGPSLDADMTWFPGCEVGPEDSKYELDFVAFWRKRWGMGGQVRVLMGECKTFDKFTAKEVLRFRAVAKKFPKTIRVFATLRAELEQDEKSAIAGLAREGRRLGGSRSPVLVLTATELLSTRQPPYCYDGAGARFEKFKDYNPAPMAGDDGLLGLCDLTQQLHLDMEATWTTIDKEVATRRARRTSRKPSE